MGFELCPTCGEHGDLVYVRVRNLGKIAIACTECDLFWEGDEPGIITADSAVDVSSYLTAHGLPASWDEFEIIGKVDR